MSPSDYAELKRIEELLICGICYEYMKTTVITSCSHNYCSLCIRKYLHYKTQCPTCFEQTFERDLRKNKVVDDIIGLFSHIKERLQKSKQVSNASVENNKTQDIHNTCKTESKDQSIIQTPIKKPESKDKIHVQPMCNLSPQTCKEIEKTVASPSTSGQLKISSIFSPKSNKDVQSPGNGKVVMCPVCKVNILENRINKHLDDCLKREAAKDQPVKIEASRKPLPKLVFSLMKDSMIRKKLKELGLVSQGDRKTLEARLQKYIVLYNSECDKTDPRPVPELIKQCEDEENLEKKINKTCSSSKRLQVNRNTEENVIEEERKKYLETYKSSFDHLITRIRTTEGRKRLSARRSILHPDIDHSSDSPQKNQCIEQRCRDFDEDNDTNDFQRINYDDIDVHDSDSNTICPLQMYSSKGPMNYVKAELRLSPGDDANQIQYAFNHETPRKQRQSDLIDSPKKAIAEDKGVFYSGLKSMSPKITENKVLCEKKIEDHPAKRIKKKGDTVIYADHRTDSPSHNAIKQEFDEANAANSIITDILQDLSSNDSTDYKSHYGMLSLSRTVSGSVQENLTGFSNLEKENISSSSECSDVRPLRKRGHNPTLNDEDAIVNIRQKVKKSSRMISSTEVLIHEQPVSGALASTRNERYSKPKSERRENASNKGENNINILRKSSRTRCANNLL
ncbi:hypothetical protein KM043_002430 [Ampulex compressa]|nr:hypothetical protein KM043_002430 [Ampulex compressa]